MIQNIQTILNFSKKKNKFFGNAITKNVDDYHKKMEITMAITRTIYL
jgi:hypothetical protein